MNLLTLFARAHQNLALTPQERALLKLIEGVIWAGVIAAVGVLANLLGSGQFALNQQTLLAVVGAGVAAIFAAVHKLNSASGDPLLSAAVGVVESEVARYLPLHQQAAPAAAPAPVAPSAAVPAAPAAVPASAI